MTKHSSHHDSIRHPALSHLVKFLICFKVRLSTKKAIHQSQAHNAVLRLQNESLNLVSAATYAFKVRTSYEVYEFYKVLSQNFWVMAIVVKPRLVANGYAIIVKLCSYKTRMLREFLKMILRWVNSEQLLMCIICTPNLYCSILAIVLTSFCRRSDCEFRRRNSRAFAWNDNRYSVNRRSIKCSSFPAAFGWETRNQKVSLNNSPRRNGDLTTV